MNPKYEHSINSTSYRIFADGGSRGNPGEAAYGFVVFNENEEKVYEEGKKLGVQTNNFAEYSAVIAALQWIKNQLSITNQQTLNLNFFLDSQLAVMQLSGKWKIKNENLRNLFFTVKELERKIGGLIIYQHVLREFNKVADRQVNLALDGKI